MRRVFLTIAVVAGLLSLGYAQPAYASGVSIQPALVKSDLAAGEKKKGFVDVVNPTSSKAIISFSVQAFRQTDDRGTLEFYDDPGVTRGLKLDLNEVELGGHEALRLYYVADGALLPAGDVLAAIFATVAPTANAPAAQAVRVGTLVVLHNGPSVGRQVAITSLAVSPVQFGPSLAADFTIKNTADPVNAFFPKVTVATTPYGQQTIDAPLVAAGRQRSITYVKPGNFVGFVQLTISLEGAKRSVWVFAVTGVWRWLLPLMIVLLAGCAFVWVRYRHRRRPRLGR